MILELSTTNTCFTVSFFHGFVVFILWYRSGKEILEANTAALSYKASIKLFFGEGTDEI